MIDAVVFDLDGVLLDSEQLWDEVREELARQRGGRWHEHAQRDMMGMSSPEWSRYMHDVIGLCEPPEEISTEVVRRMGERYRDGLPLLPGAVEAVERLAARWPLGLASSSNRPLIDDALGWLECETRAEHAIGDHTLFVGEVVAVAPGEARRPLVYVDRHFVAV